MKELFSKWVNPKAFDTKKLRTSFSSASPFPHVLIKNVLQEERFAKLREAVSKEKRVEKECDLFHFFQSDELKFSKNAVIQEFYALLGSKEFVQRMQEVSKVTLGPGVFDTFVALYAPTHFLLCHDDRLEKRKIAFIFYVQPSKEGGRVQLFSSSNGHPAKVSKAYMPLANSLLIFQVSKRSFHAVEEVTNGERISVGGWFH